MSSKKTFFVDVTYLLHHDELTIDMLPINHRYAYLCICECHKHILTEGLSASNGWVRSAFSSVAKPLINFSFSNDKTYTHSHTHTNKAILITLGGSHATRRYERGKLL